MLLEIAQRTAYLDHQTIIEVVTLPLGDDT